jgi:HSP20 family molecular chaperone IbpA
MNFVCETDGEYHVRADLPAADVAVGVDDGVAAIAGERKFERAEQSEKAYRRQSLRGALPRDLALQDEGG